MSLHEKEKNKNLTPSKLKKSSPVSKPSTSPAGTSSNSNEINARPPWSISTKLSTNKPSPSKRSQSLVNNNRIGTPVGEKFRSKSANGSETTTNGNQTKNIQSEIREASPDELSKDQSPTTPSMSEFELLPANPITLRPSSVSEKDIDLIQLRDVSQLKKIADGRYVDQFVWMQHIVKKIKEITVEDAPPEIAMVEEKEEENISQYEDAKSANEKIVSPPITAQSSPTNGLIQKPLSDVEVIENEDYRPPFDLNETYPVAFYEKNLSTIEEEKTEEIQPPSSVNSSGLMTPASISSKFSTVVGMESPVRMENTLIATYTEKDGDGSDSANEWNEDLIGNLDAHEFIRQMMYPSPSVLIETVDPSMQQIDFVFLNDRGKIALLCGGVSSMISNDSEVD